MPFPLDFAPELPYRGLEELRFAPKFFNPDAPAYWSYAFAWWLEKTAPIDEIALREALTPVFPRTLRRRRRRQVLLRGQSFSDHADAACARGGPNGHQLSGPD